MREYQSVSENFQIFFVKDNDRQDRCEHYVNYSSEQKSKYKRKVRQLSVGFVVFPMCRSAHHHNLV